MSPERKIPQIIKRMRMFNTLEIVDKGKTMKPYDNFISPFPQDIRAIRGNTISAILKNNENK